MKSQDSPSASLPIAEAYKPDIWCVSWDRGMDFQ